MKKVISVVLALILFIVPLTAFAYAADDTEYEQSKTFHVTLPQNTNQHKCYFCPGYSDHVIQGGTVKFKIDVIPQYSKEFGTVYYSASNYEVANEEGYDFWIAIYPDEDDVYTIENVQADITVKISKHVTAGGAGLFNTIIGFFRVIFKALDGWFKSLNFGIGG